MPIWSSPRPSLCSVARRPIGSAHAWRRWSDWRCSLWRPASLPPPAHKLCCWPDGPCRGFGGALAVPSTLAAVDTRAQPERRAGAIAAWTGFLMLGFSIGPLLGGALTHFTSWRVIFWLNVLLMSTAMAGLASAGRATTG